MFNLNFKFMKKKILMFLVCAFAVVGMCLAAGEVVKRANNDPCGRCNIADENRKCGKCGSMLNCSVVSKDEGELGTSSYKLYWIYTYTCTKCNHTCVNKERVQ